MYTSNNLAILHCLHGEQARPRRAVLKETLIHVNMQPPPYFASFNHWVVDQYTKEHRLCFLCYFSNIPFDIVRSIVLG